MDGEDSKEVKSQSPDPKFENPNKLPIEHDPSMSHEHRPMIL
jgi:hypothetical protein